MEISWALNDCGDRRRGNNSLRISELLSGFCGVWDNVRKRLHWQCLRKAHVLPKPAFPVKDFKLDRDIRGSRSYIMFLFFQVTNEYLDWNLNIFSMKQFLEESMHILSPRLCLIFSPAVGYVEAPRAGPGLTSVFVQVNGFPSFRWLSHKIFPDFSPSDVWNLWLGIFLLTVSLSLLIKSFPRTFKWTRYYLVWVWDRHTAALILALICYEPLIATGSFGVCLVSFMENFCIYMLKLYGSIIIVLCLSV